MHARFQDSTLNASKTDRNSSKAVSNMKQGKYHSSIVIIGKSKIIRDALSYSLRIQASDLSIETAESLQHCPASVPDLVIINISGFDGEFSYIQEAVDLAAQHFGSTPLLLIVDPGDDSSLLHLAHEKGFAGCVPSTLGVDVVLAAVRLALVGGKFSLDRYVDHNTGTYRNEKLNVLEGAIGNDYPCATLTPKEREIVHYLRLGKQNKNIAHEMHIAESTVKVHVRNIMKKLQAQNRTQIAVLMHSEVTHVLKAN